jgi:hypothetical protein
MTAETLLRLYNVGAFHRTVSGSPDHRKVYVEIDGAEHSMTLAELEGILTRNKERLAIIARQQRPLFVNSVVQPYAKAS